MVKISIRQLDIKSELIFCSYNFTVDHAGKVNIDNYKKVWSGYVEANDLEDIFIMFNFKHPHGFNGHSLSVSDLVEVDWSDNGMEEGVFFVDDFGFKKII